MNKGFSLAETLVVLVIIGVISTLMVPVISNSMNASIQASYKSAFNTASTVLSSVLADTVSYPNGILTNSNTTAPMEMFCNSFATSINIVGTTNCVSSNVSTNSPNFTTTNGMKWYGFENNFNSYGNMTVQVDINGKGQNIYSIVIANTGQLSTPDATGTEATYLLN